MFSAEVSQRITNLSAAYDIPSKELESLVLMCIEHSNPVKTRMSMGNLKSALFKHFEADSVPQMKRKAEYKMLTDGQSFDLRQKSSWEALYRLFIGVLPGEEGQEGENCINGVDIFDYFKPWQVFGLTPGDATPGDIKCAYRGLAQKYHPDNTKTGNARIFDRINTMYHSLID